MNQLPIILLTHYFPCLFHFSFHFSVHLHFSLCLSLSHSVFLPIHSHHFCLHQWSMDRTSPYILSLSLWVCERERVLVMQSCPSAVFTGQNQVQVACKLAGWVRPCADKVQTLFMEGQTTKPMNNLQRRLRRLLLTWSMSKHLKPVCQHKNQPNPTLDPVSLRFPKISYHFHICPLKW